MFVKGFKVDVLRWGLSVWGLLGVDYNISLSSKPSKRTTPETVQSTSKRLKVAFLLWRKFVSLVYLSGTMQLTLLLLLLYYYYYIMCNSMINV